MTMIGDINFMKLHNIVVDFTDEIKSKTMFNDLKDCLCKGGEISEKTYDNAYLNMDKKNKKAYICCGSYKVRV